MRKFTTFITLLFIVLIVGIALFFSCTPSGKYLWNSWFHDVQKADDISNYDTRKQVEDTCRAMISSYTADKLIYEQYKDSTIEEQRSWADQAKMRANQTAATYNNYVLANGYVWRGNVPSDISGQLTYLP